MVTIAPNEAPLKGDRAVADTGCVRRSLSLAVAVACLVSVSTAIAGTGQPSFALNPVHYDPSLTATKSYFVAVARPGGVIRNSVRVANTGTQTGTAYLYAVDATTGRTSGAVYFDRRVARRDVGAWISISARSVTLAPKQSRVVDFVVRVPPNARPGDHLGGIVAENTRLTDSSGSGALQIRIRHLTIAAVEVQVPGSAATRVDVTNVRAAGQHGWQYLYLHLANTGSLTTKPTGRLVLFDSHGAEIASRQLQLDTFLPRTVIDYPVLLPKQALPPGAYRATVKLTYGASALGYRRQPGPLQTIARSFGVIVTPAQYTSVFKGVPAVGAPPRASAQAHTEGNNLVFLLAGGLIGVASAFLVLVLGIRRWRPSH
jgi:hypothetical protein